MPRRSFRGYRASGAAIAGDGLAHAREDRSAILRCAGHAIAPKNCRKTKTALRALKAVSRSAVAQDLSRPSGCIPSSAVARPRGGRQGQARLGRAREAFGESSSRGLPACLAPTWDDNPPASGLNERGAGRRPAPKMGGGRWGRQSFGFGRHWIQFR